MMFSGVIWSADRDMPFEKRLFSVREVEEKMNKLRIGSVVGRDKPVGITSQGDILRKVVEPGHDLGALRPVKSREPLSTPSKARPAWNRLPEPWPNGMSNNSPSREME